MKKQSRTTGSGAVPQETRGKMYSFIIFTMTLRETHLCVFFYTNTVLLCGQCWHLRKGHNIVNGEELQLKTVVFWMLKWKCFQMLCIQQNLRVINYIYHNFAWAHWEQHKVHGLTRRSMSYQDCPLIPSTVLGLFAVQLFCTCKWPIGRTKHTSEARCKL